jgi:tetratricopeptide (TPR) repeat protein
VRHLTCAIALTLTVAATTAAAADELDGCRSGDLERRIAACTALIDAPGTDPDQRARAFFLRGLARTREAQYERALPDFDEAIRIAPSFAMALNSRANAHLKLGRASHGVADIDLALSLDPREPIFTATRGEISQALGDRNLAMRYHEATMALGGAIFVQFYQCSLRLAQLYHGPLDGIATPELHTALRLCVDQGSRCAPLPPFPISECPEPVG